MKVKWSDLKVGDFFQYLGSSKEDIPQLYQKVAENGIYNAVLLNDGQLCNLHTESSIFEKVSVSFEIHKE